MGPLELFWTRCEGPLVFGQNDCCTTLADVLVAAGAVDLMQPYRGRFSTAKGFARVFRRAGFLDLASAISARLAACGQQVAAPDPFDVALVSYIQDGRPAVAPGFYHSGFWNLRSDKGMAAFRDGVRHIYRVL